MYNSVIYFLLETLFENFLEQKLSHAWFFFSFLIKRYWLCPKCFGEPRNTFLPPWSDFCELSDLPNATEYQFFFSSTYDLVWKAKSCKFNTISHCSIRVYHACNKHPYEDPEPCARGHKNKNGFSIVVAPPRCYEQWWDGFCIFLTRFNLWIACLSCFLWNKSSELALPFVLTGIMLLFVAVHCKVLEYLAVFILFLTTTYSRPFLPRGWVESKLYRRRSLQQPPAFGAHNTWCLAAKRVE